MGSVWEKNGIAPTIDTMTGGLREPMIIEETKIAYEYGRKADIERLKKAVCDGEKHLCKLNKMPEDKLTTLNDGEICDIDAPYASTITARYWKGIGAHKDNMVLEGQKIDMKKCVEKVFMAIDEQNMAVRSETIGTLTTDGNSPKHNNRVAECKRLGSVGGVNTQSRSVYSPDNMCPTLCSGMGEHSNTVPYITEEKAIKIRQATEQGYTLCEVGGQ